MRQKSGPQKPAAEKVFEEKKSFKTSGKRSKLEAALTVCPTQKIGQEMSSRLFEGRFINDMVRQG